MGLKNAKAKGSRNERRTMAFVEAQGYYCVKTGGSLGIWDVLCVGLEPGKGGILVQVKSTKWPGATEMKTLAEFTCDPVFKRYVHRWRKYQREPDIRELD